MKNNPALEQWGQFDQRTNEPSTLKEPWRATSAVVFAAITPKYKTGYSQYIM